MSYDLVHHAWANKQGIFNVYTSCGRRALSLRVTAVVAHVTCPACTESDSFQEAAAESLETALAGPSWKDLLSKGKPVGSFIDVMFGKPFNDPAWKMPVTLPPNFKIPDLRLKR